MWLGYASLFALFFLLDLLVWDASPVLDILVGAAAVVSVGAAALYWHTTLRGKFLLWDELRRRTARAARLIRSSATHGPSRGEPSTFSHSNEGLPGRTPS